jgi:hypothetical protein
MSIKQLINQKIDHLSENEQKKVLDFIINIIKQENLENEINIWNRFSLKQAMRDLENDNLPEYTEDDLIEKW